MDDKSLHELLTELHAELEKADRVDASTKASMAAVTDDIQRLLSSEDSSSSEDSETLAARMKESLLEFETEHPQLTRVVNQISSALAHLGI